MMAVFDAVGGTAGIPSTNMVKRFEPLALTDYYGGIYLSSALRCRQ